MKTTLIFVMLLCWGTIAAQEEFSYYQSTMWYLKASEGLKLTPYFCIAKTKTGGWGNTHTMANTLVGANKDIKEYLQKLYNKNSCRFQHLSHNQILAVSALEYNVGEIGPSLARAINNLSPNLSAIWNQYIYVNGKPNRVLKKRRFFELQLFFNNEPYLKIMLKEHKREVLDQIKNQL